jgi:hypothetical protein
MPLRLRRGGQKTGIEAQTQVLQPGPKPVAK